MEYTQQNPDCHSWWFSKMQSGREDTLEEWYAKKFCFKLGKNPREKYGMLQTAFGASCMNQASVFEWYKRFKCWLSLNPFVGLYLQLHPHIRTFIRNYNPHKHTHTHKHTLTHLQSHVKIPTKSRRFFTACFWLSIHFFLNCLIIVVLPKNTMKPRGRSLNFVNYIYIYIYIYILGFTEHINHERVTSFGQIPIPFKWPMDCELGSSPSNVLVQAYLAIPSPVE